MRTLLHVVTGADSHDCSSIYLKQFLARWRGGQTAGTIIQRDLAAVGLRDLDDETRASFITPARLRTLRQTATIGISDELVAELLLADAVLLTMPKCIFRSQLKTWIDYVTRPGITFIYGEAGAQGLLCEKQVYLLCSEATDDCKRIDSSGFRKNYLLDALGCLGLNDIKFLAPPVAP